MPFPLSPQSIDAIAEIISGGSGNDPAPPIGIYRSGPKIEKFMLGCNVAFKVDGSRVPSLVQCLININNSFEVAQVLPRILEAAADPRDFLNEPETNPLVNSRNGYGGYAGYTAFSVIKVKTGELSLGAIDSSNDVGIARHGHCQTFALP